MLPSGDLDQTTAFYAKLGFDVMSRYADDYLILVREGRELHFFFYADVDPKTSIAGCYWRISDPEGFHREITARGIVCLDEPEIKPWGMFEFALSDPDGNLLRLGERLQ